MEAEEKQTRNLAYVATGEVTALEHEVGDDAVEGRALVAESLLAGAKSTEVLSGPGDVLIEEVESDALSLDYITAEKGQPQHRQRQLIQERQVWQSPNCLNS